MGESACQKNGPSVRGTRLGPSFQRMPVAARHPAVLSRAAEKRPQQGLWGAELGPIPAASNPVKQAANGQPNYCNSG